MKNKNNLFIWNKSYCSIKPVIELIAIKIERIIAVSFLSLFFVSKTNNPKPPAEDNPAINEPKLIVCLINNIVSITDIAQFGIKPIIDAKIGCSGEFSKNNFAKCSSVPATEIIYPNIIETIKMNTKILKVCFNGCSHNSFDFVISERW